MIQKTFDRNGSAVPEFIKKACIYEKEKRSRKERAEIFLRFILGHEQLLMDFKTVFNESSTFSLPQVPCEAHGGMFDLLYSKLLIHSFIYLYYSFFIHLFLLFLFQKFICIINLSYT